MSYESTATVAERIAASSRVRFVPGMRQFCHGGRGKLGAGAGGALVARNLFLAGGHLLVGAVLPGAGLSSADLPGALVLAALVLDAQDLARRVPAAPPRGIRHDGA